MLLLFERLSYHLFKCPSPPFNSTGLSIGFDVVMKRQFGIIQHQFSLAQESTTMIIVTCAVVVGITRGMQLPCLASQVAQYKTHCSNGTWQKQTLKHVFPASLHLELFRKGWKIFDVVINEDQENGERILFDLQIYEEFPLYSNRHLRGKISSLLMRLG